MKCSNIKKAALFADFSQTVRLFIYCAAYLSTPQKERSCVKMGG